MEYRYGVYGVALTSDLAFEFPGDEPHRTAAGARVTFSRGDDDDFATARDRESTEWFTCDERRDGSLYLRWRRFFEFVVAPCGTRVQYRPLGEGDDAVLQNFLFGQALSFALVRQGLEPLHAAVVDVTGQALALLGDCGYGKSTLAGAFVRAGCRLLSDDVLVVYRDGGQVMAAAGAGRIKWLPDTACAFERAAEDGVQLNPQAEKRVFRLGEGDLQRRDIPLAAFLVLPPPQERDRASRFDVQRVTSADLFYELVKNTFVRPLQDSRRLRQNFSFNAQLASEIPGYRVSYPSGIDRLPAVCDAVIDRFAKRGMP